MKLTRMKVCTQVDQRLSQLQSKLKLTPNLICRIGFCLSLNDPMVPDPEAYPQDSSRELNRYTLTGEWDDYFIALLRERCDHDKLDLEKHLEDQFRAHINRGVLLINQRAKNQVDLGRLIQEANQRFAQQAEKIL